MYMRTHVSCLDVHAKKCIRGYTLYIVGAHRILAMVELLVVIASFYLPDIVWMVLESCSITVRPLIHTHTHIFMGIRQLLNYQRV